MNGTVLDARGTSDTIPDMLLRPNPVRLRASRHAPMSWWLAVAVAAASLLATTASLAQAPAAPAAEAAAAAGTVAKLRRSGVILLGHRQAAVPFSYLVDGQPRGYAIDLCLRVVEGLRGRLNLPALRVQWVPLQAADRLPAVREGRVDLECGNTTATAERRKAVSFTTPVFIAGAGVLARADARATTLQNLRGKRIAVASGTTGEKIVNLANEMMYGITPVIVKDNAEAFAAVEQGRAEAWITDDVLLAAFRAQAAKPTDFVLLDKRHTIEPLALMVRKDDADFERAIDGEMSELLRSGEVLRLYIRWFTQPIPPRNVNLELPPSRLLREIVRTPLKMQHEVDVIVL
jgi:ABC-type amino acid transport substrate-binding protein